MERVTPHPSWNVPVKPRAPNEMYLFVETISCVAITVFIDSGLSPFSGKWFCSFCRDLSVPEMEYDCDSKPGAKIVKEEPDSDGGFPPVDRRVSTRLLKDLCLVYLQYVVW